MLLDASLLDRALETLGALLEQRGHHVEVVAVGGSALLLLGAISRSTQDLDLVALVRGGRFVSASPLPPELVAAASDVAAALDLPERWLNPGPTDLLHFGLPPGFERRLITRGYRGLVVHLASRVDQICLKLYAAVDQGPRSKHAADLRQLAPTGDELMEAARWARTHDPSDGFRQEMVAALRLFDVEADDFDRP